MDTLGAFNRRGCLPLLTPDELRHWGHRYTYSKTTGGCRLDLIFRTATKEVGKEVARHPEKLFRSPTLPGHFRDRRFTGTNPVSSPPNFLEPDRLSGWATYGPDEPRREIRISNANRSGCSAIYFHQRLAGVPSFDLTAWPIKWVAEIRLRIGYSILWRPSS